MRVIGWDVLCHFLLLCAAVKGKETISCRNVISISCDMIDVHIVMMGINTTSNIASRLLVQCNAHHDCQVSNMKKECVKIEYWCRMDFPVLEINATSTAPQTIKGNTSILGLMSADYYNRKHQDAANVNCELTLVDDGFHATQMKEVKITVHELSPFSTSKEFCLMERDSILPLICSGSGLMYTTHGRFDGEDAFQFSLILKKSARSIPKVRFWLDIAVLPDHGYQKHLECKTQPSEDIIETVLTTVSLDTSNATAGLSGYSMVIVVSAVLGSLLLLCILIFSLVIVCMYRKRKSAHARRSVLSHVEKEEDYSYIDMTDICSEVEGYGVEVIPPPLPKDRKAGVNLEADDGSEDSSDSESACEDVQEPRFTDDTLPEDENDCSVFPVMAVAAVATNKQDNNSASISNEVECVQEAIENLECIPHQYHLETIPDLELHRQESEGDKTQEHEHDDANDSSSCSSGLNYEGLCEGWQSPEQDENGSTHEVYGVLIGASENHEVPEVEGPPPWENDNNRPETDYTLLEKNPINSGQNEVMPEEK